METQLFYLTMKSFLFLRERENVLETFHHMTAHTWQWKIESSSKWKDKRKRELEKLLWEKLSMLLCAILPNISLHRCCHSSVDLSAPTILLPRVRVPSTPSMLFSFIVLVLHLSCGNNKNKQKEAGLAH